MRVSNLAHTAANLALLVQLLGLEDIIAAIALKTWSRTRRARDSFFG